MLFLHGIYVYLLQLLEKLLYTPVSFDSIGFFLWFANYFGVVLNLIVRVNIGLGRWTTFGLVWGQFGGFQTNKLYRLIG